MTPRDRIIVRGARTHNLKGIDCSFPHRGLSVVTGVSGSGKSSLVFDTIFGEGHRRYLETLSTYTRQQLERMRRPEVDWIRNLPPTVAIRQESTGVQPRSTVGTVSELADYLSVLFAAIGSIECTQCGSEVRSQSPTAIASAIGERYSGTTVLLCADVEVGDDPETWLEILARRGFSRLYLDDQIVRLEETSPAGIDGYPSVLVIIDRLRLEMDSSPAARLLDSVEIALELGDGRVVVQSHDRVGEDSNGHFYSALRCNQCGAVYPKPSAEQLSFNSPLGACPGCNGFGRVMGLDLDLVVPDARDTIRDGAIAPLMSRRGRYARVALETMCLRNHIPLDLPWKQLTAEQRDVVIGGDDVYGGVEGFFATLESEPQKSESAMILARYRRQITCRSCGGSRLSESVRSVLIDNHHIGALFSMTLDEVRTFLVDLELDHDERQSVDVVLEELMGRVGGLLKSGLSYLTLSRATTTLSAGELQRIRLATCIGRALVDACYVLDEPTAGLHPRDTERLVEMLWALRDLGNTVIVVEHDLQVIEAADHVLELGPKGGEGGGLVVFEGTVGELQVANTATAEALTSDCSSTRELGASAPLGSSKRHPDPTDEQSWLRVEGAYRHNLKELTVAFPLNALTVVTGVSGSGKTTLVFDVLYNEMEAALRFDRTRDRRGCERVCGARRFGSVSAMERPTKGLTSRSTIISFSGVLEPIRKLLSETYLARERGLTPFHFSTNVRGGRCDRCEGMGVHRIDLHFLAGVEVICESCEGTRFKPGVLEVRVDGLNIYEIHRLTVSEAAHWFRKRPDVTRRLRSLLEVGLGYLRLGQPTQTLSGGELQRLRISEFLTAGPGAAVCGAKTSLSTLFLFDEPSIGMHAVDVEQLLACFDRLLIQGHTIIVVEHNLEIIAAADWIIDLGPEGGPRGGEVVVSGSPGDVADCARSSTGRFLQRFRTKTSPLGPQISGP